MNKRVLFVLYPSYGHTYYILPTIEQLIQKGVKVSCLTANYLKHLFNIPDLNVFLYQEINDCNIHQATAENDLIDHVFNAAAENVQQYNSNLKIAQEIDPDIIVFDSLCYFGKMIAHELSIPCCTISPLMVYNQDIFEKNPDVLLNNICRKKLIFSQSEEADRQKKIKMTKLEKLLSKQIKSRFLINDCHYWEVVSCYSQKNFIFTSRLLQRNQEVLDDRFRFVGCTILRSGNSNKKLSHIKHPLIYISLGTTHVNNNTCFYQKCIDAFSDSNYSVIISVGERINQNELKNVSENITLLSNINQISVLQNANLFITHAGANGFNESCYFGVPMIACPQQGDQFDIANRIVELNIGVKINSDFTSIDFKHLTDDILNDTRIIENAKQLSGQLKREHCNSIASEEIYQYICNSGG